MLHKMKYECPNCNWKLTRDLDYPDNFSNPENSHITISTWCIRCEFPHQFDISISQNKNGEYRIRTNYFLINGERSATKLNLI